jgi:hypothetical protein
MCGSLEFHALNPRESEKGDPSIRASTVHSSKPLCTHASNMYGHISRPLISLDVIEVAAGQYSMTRYTSFVEYPSHPFSLQKDPLLDQQEICIDRVLHL